MTYPYIRSAAQDKHKVFVSYYHNDDQAYKNLFEARFGSLFIAKSVEPGDIDSDLSTDYIKQLIQQDYISDASVVLVLVGPKTKCRKHVDWEVSAGLNKKVGGYSGLLGVLVPTFPMTGSNQYDYDGLPARLADNVKKGYAHIYGWADLTAAQENVKRAIQGAFDRRVSQSAKIDNARVQMTYNTCD
jgi:hypothetical protein